MKLYAKDSPDKLLEHLKLPDLSCDINDSAKTLTANNRHHGLALLFQRQQADAVDKALEIWADLLAGRLNDPGFPGLEFYSRQIAK